MQYTIELMDILQWSELVKSNLPQSSYVSRSNIVALIWYAQMLRLLFLKKV